MSNQNLVRKVLEDLRHRWPEATEADALAILEDEARDEADYEAWNAREQRAHEASLDWMGEQ